MIDSPRPRRRIRRTAKSDQFPSPEAIRRMTEEIRKSWTPRELRRRSGKPRHYEIAQMPLEPRRRGQWDE